MLLKKETSMCSAKGYQGNTIEVGPQSIMYVPANMRGKL